ncbi:MAG: TonB-dependent receptor [Sphingomonadaceae bacterium]|nr:TonB-dependent receptor [Sphingomonadaceae bacterium]
MSKTNIRHRLLASTIVAGAVVASAPAFAQVSDQTAPAGSISGAANAATAPTTSADASPASTNGGEIIVTGSRIPQPNLTSTSPVTVVTSQELKLQGTTRVEDLLNSLPQVFADQGGFSNNPSDGTATINLRNLGAQRTLVLIDGHRMQVGDPITAGGADINMIPDVMIKRIDVLTGGAGSVYGSDAVAGVVNFIMDTDFTGVSVDGQYSLYPHNNANKTAQGLVDSAGYPDPKGPTVDGRTFDVSVKIGAATDDGRGHVVGYFNYRKISAVTQGDRDYSACGLNEDNSLPAGRYCGGSPIAAPANIFGVNSGTFQVGPGRTAIPGYGVYNYAPTNYFQRNDKRYTAGFFARYEVSDAFKPYAEFMFMDDDSSSHTAPGGDFTDTSTVNCDNPLLAANAGAFAAICGDPLNVTVGADGVARGTAFIGRRNVEGGPRINEYRHTDYRAVLGSKGDIAKGISYDVSFQYGDVQLHETATDYFSISRLNNALDVITDPVSGLPVCRSGGTCVPYNIWTGTTTLQGNVADGVTQAALDYLEAPSFISGETTEKVASGSFTILGGEYGIQSPWSSEGIGLNIGAEYRRETLKVASDALSSSGDLSGFGSASPPINNGFDVKEGFAELRLPIASDKPFIKELVLTGGYRYSSYNPEGSVSSYKGQIEYAPISDIRFRGGYNRAVRAPNVAELFAPNQVALDGSHDPCEGATPTFTLAQCMREGVTAAEYGNITANPAKQYYGQIGGPVDPSTLKPEKSDTYTVGVVLTPSFLRGFNLSVDAYRIKINGLIAPGLGEDNILDECGRTGEAIYCGLIHRNTDPGAEGSLWLNKDGYVVDTTLNAGSETTQGIDIAANYTYRMEKWGSLGFSVFGTYIDKFVVDNVGPSKFDCVGYFGATCGTPIPHWRHKARLTWTTPWNVSLSGQWRFIGKTKVDTLNPNINPDGTGINTVDEHIKNVSYFDLTATARLANKVSLRIGAQNLFDKDPPILGSAVTPSASLGAGNTFPQVYDVLGRYVFVGASVDF